MPIVGAAFTALAPFAVPAAAGAIAYTAISGSIEAKAARKTAKEEAEKQRKLQEKLFNKELEAGEYFEELQMQQMELQAQSANISTLADLIASRREGAAGPQVFTLPPAKTETALTRLNRALDDLFAGLSLQG